AGEIDSRLVDTQQARRIIDRLVGYEVSDLLWKKIWRGLSAGRVQTVALRIISERESEIEAFVPVEYWTVDANLEAGAPPPFPAKLVSFEGQKLKFDGTDPRLESEASAARVREEAERAVWRVAKVDTSERRKNPPAEVSRHVSADEAKLYRLIWERFVGSQMAAAVYDTVSAEIEAGKALYRASGSTLKTPGYLAVYGVSAEEDEDAEKDGAKLPPLTAGETLKLVAIEPERKETQPPPRYNEASLVKFLEENGIGRPSTYVEILRKLEDR